MESLNHLSGLLGLVAIFIALGAGVGSWRNAAMRARIEDLERNAREQGKRIEELETKLVVVESERDTARRELVQHFAARVELAEENRALHNENRDLHKEVIRLTKAG